MPRTIAVSLMPRMPASALHRAEGRLSMGLLCVGGAHNLRVLQKRPAIAAAGPSVVESSQPKRNTFFFFRAQKYADRHRAGPRHASVQLICEGIRAAATNASGGGGNGDKRYDTRWDKVAGLVELLPRLGCTARR